TLQTFYLQQRNFNKIQKNIASKKFYLQKRQSNVLHLLPYHGNLFTLSVKPLDFINLATVKLEFYDITGKHF
ncbi:MAG: hypothetical protein QXY79_04260, partial [Candidatus Methanomethylicia archaeon]